MSGGTHKHDVLPYARDHDRTVARHDVKDFGDLPSDPHAGIVILYDDTMPAYRVAAGLIAMADAYPEREAFGGHEELDPWV